MIKSNVTSTLPINYFLKFDPKNKKTFLLLHGYSQKADFLWNQLKDKLPEDANILAPQGIFPLIKQFPLGKREEGEELFSGYAWYFFDATTGSFPIDYNTPVSAIEALLTDLDLIKTDITIIGYSQGAYLSLFVAERIKSVSKIIGINGAWRWDRLEKELKIEINSLNGENDIIVDPQKSQDGHRQLLNNGCTGKFIEIKKEGHKLTPPFIDKLLSLIK